MIDFTFQSYLKLDMKGLDKSNETPDIDDLPKMVIKRNLTISDLMRYLKEINAELDEGSLKYIVDLKERMVLRDAKLFMGAGYKQVYIRDLAPGSTQISYILSSEGGYVPSYIGEELKK